MAKIMLNGVDYSAPTTGAVAGVKGNEESEYRAGYVNLTPENIGAASKTQAIIEKSLFLVSESSDEAVLIATLSPGAIQPPLKIIIDKIIYEGDTGSGIFQTGGTIRMTGEYANISFDNIDNVGATSIKPKYIITNKLEANTVDAQKIVNNSNPGIIIDTPQVDVYGKVIPYPDNGCDLGNSSHRWRQLYAGTSTISTSDRNLKKDIESLDDKWVQFFMLLQPKSYIFKDGDSGRTHVGFISQDVEEVLAVCGLTGTDFAGFCKDQKIEYVTETKKIIHPANEETGEEEWVEEKNIVTEKPVTDDDGNPVYVYSLRYEEFIALNTMMIQKQQNKINELESRINTIEKIIL